VTNLPSWSPHNLQKHFQKHGSKFPFATAGAYAASALAIVQGGRRFTYNDPQSGDPRVGYYDSTTNGFVSVSDDELAIITYYPPRRGEQYVRDLPQSTYV
jgi:pyocin large subunit-like protein